MSTTNVHHHRPHGTRWARFHERVQLAHRRTREALESLVTRQGPQAGSLALELGTGPHHHRAEHGCPRAWVLALEFRLGNVRVAAALARVPR